MTPTDDPAPGGRLDRRKARTRAALVEAAQVLLAEGRTNVPVASITEAADLGTGSFYNHFASKDELFAAALADAVERHADRVEQLTAEVDDPAAVFALGFRLTGRLHRAAPRLSKVLLRTGVAGMNATTGLAPRARRDIAAAVAAGRFTVPDLDVAMVSVVGATLCLGQLLHDRPELDDARTTDLVTADVLRVLGMAPGEADGLAAAPLPPLR